MSAQNEQKELVRRACRAARDAIPSAEREVLSARILAHLVATEAYQSAEALLLYAPIRSEIDPMGLLPLSREAGKRVYFPVSERDGRMTFYRVNTSDELTVGLYGIREPKSRTHPYRGESPALCLLPGLAFDEEGYRIGYGGGYYDRFLAAHPTLCRVGLVYHALLHPALPREPFDIPADLVISEKGVRIIRV